MNILVPLTLQEALATATFHTNYHFLAGGSDIILRQKKENTLSGMIWLGKIEELQTITYTEESIRIGSMLTLTSLREEPTLMTLFPLLSQAIAVFGSHQIRSTATMGGNIANASAAADLLPVLMVLGASIEITSPSERRYMRIEELIKSYRNTVLEPNEIITAIHLPKKQWDHHYYRKIGRRSTLNISIASLAAVGQKREDRGWNVHLSGASLAPNPRRMVQTEALFREPATPKRETVLEALRHDIDPRSGMRGSREYRLEVTANMVMEFADALD